MKTFLLGILILSVSSCLVYCAVTLREYLHKLHQKKVIFLDTAFNFFVSAPALFLSLFGSYLCLKSIFEFLAFQEGLFFLFAIIIVATSNFLYFYIHCLFARLDHMRLCREKNRASQAAICQKII